MDNGVLLRSARDGQLLDAALPTRVRCTAPNLPEKPCTMNTPAAPNRIPSARRQSVVRLAAAALCIAALATPNAWAQKAKRAAVEAPWPSKPIKILVGFPPGSTPDMAARTLADALSKALGQPVVVENKPGASGNIAADAVAKATDDHTLGVVINGNLTSAKMLFAKLPYDPAKDFTPISLLTTAPLVLVTTPNQPGGNEFFLTARNSGDKWNYGSVGVGSLGHLGMELIKGKAGNFNALHVPYPGNPQVVTAMLGGQLQMALIPPGVALPHIRSGKIKAVGLTSGRSTLAPELPSLAEAGLDGLSLEVWTALVGPASLSKAAQKRLSVVGELIRSPEVRQRLFTQGWQAAGTAPEGLVGRIKSETTSMGGIIAMRGIKVE